jgi:hypothetical protein
MYEQSSERKHGRGFEVKKFGFASIAASGLGAALIGLAGPAQAGIDHHQWVHDNQQHSTVGSVRTAADALS